MSDQGSRVEQYMDGLRKMLAIRKRHGGVDSDEELKALERLDDLWYAMTDQEQREADLAVVEAVLRGEG